MRRNVILLFLFFAFLLLSCSVFPDPAVSVTEYLKGLAAKDINRLSVLSCPAWAQQSRELLDSMIAVNLKLSDLSCKQITNDGKTASVKCKGKIIVTYDSENQELDLSEITYLLVKQNNEWLVCGQK